MSTPSEPKHILFLASWYPNRTFPTLGNFVQRHARAVAQRHRVSALHVTPDPALRDRKFEVTTRMEGNLYEVQVYYQKVTSRIPGYAQWLKLARRRKAYRHAFATVLRERHQVDLVHLHVIFPAGLFALELLRKYRLPLVVTEHWTGYLPAHGHYRAAGWFHRWITQRVVKAAQVMSPVSENLAGAMRALGLNGNYQVVPNVVNTETFRPNQPGHRPRKRLLHVSTLIDAHKNISGLLRVVAAVHQERQDFELVLIGDMETEPHIRLATELGLYESVVTIEGAKTEAEVAAAMQEADGFVLFSNYENLPCVLLEAMATGIPSISTDVGGIAEHLNPTNSQLIPAGDEAALQRAIHHLLDHPEKYDAQQLRDYAVGHFSQEAIARDYDAVYRQAEQGK